MRLNFRAVEDKYKKNRELHTGFSSVHLAQKQFARMFPVSEPRLH